MVFKIYFLLSNLISLQNVSESGETETKFLAALTSIWKTVSFINQHAVIQLWHPKVEDILRPLQTSDFELHAKTPEKGS